MQHCKTLLLGALFLGFSLSGNALAQGDDTCATAQVIAGTGIFAFDNFAATTDGSPDNLCTFFGQSQIERDVWWSWSTTTSGPYTINTCGQTSVDTRIAVYDGSCAGPVIACGDDACSLQTDILFSAVAGQTYLIRVGVYPGTAGGTGTFTLDAPQPPTILATATNPANGHVYHLLDYSTWTEAELAAVQLGGHLATVNDQAEHDWITANFHNFGGVDIDLWTGFNDAQTEGNWLWSSGEPVTFTNWDLGEPNNAGTGEDYGCMRKNNTNALWNDLPDNPTGFHNQVHGLVELGAPSTVYCTAKLNALGCLPTIGSTGSPSASAGSGFVVSASNVRNNKSGLLFYGINGRSTIPFQGGTLCVASQIKRTGGITSGGTPAPVNNCTGVYALDMNAFALSVGPPIPLAALQLPGTVVNCQFWGRDPGFPAPNNTTLSDGLEYTIAP
jgi:hypothetical protein